MAALHRPGNTIPEKIAIQLKHHAPFTMLGALTGIALMVALVYASVPRTASHSLFWTFHALHVLLSALTTTAMYRLNTKKAKLWATVVVGYVGSVGIATLSDSLIPYLGEWLLDLPNRGVHVGFIEEWWLVNPLALAGIVIACVRPTTRFPHSGHVLLSTSASLFHMSMALGDEFTVWIAVPVTLFLFLAVWVPCCTSDIVFPLLFVGKGGAARAETSSPDPQEPRPNGA